MEKPVIKLKLSLKGNTATKIEPLTVQYRPFRLFPLLPVDSLLTVCIPAHPATANPAIPRRALWKPSIEADCYTDDSDAVCIAIAEGLIHANDPIPAMKLTFQVCPSSPNNSSQNTSNFSRLWPLKHDGNFWRLKAHEFINKL